MKKPTLLMLNMSHRFDWQAGMVNRNFHVRNALVESGEFEKVISVDFFPFTKKKKLKVLLKGKPWKKNAQTISRSWHTRVDQDSKHDSLLHVTSTTHKHLLDEFKKMNIDENNLVVWSYDPFTAPLLEKLKNAFVVFDAVDNWTEHPSYADFVMTLQEHYKSIAKRSDVIFTVSEGLIDFFGKKEKAIYIPNGVDGKHFASGTCNLQYLGKTGSRHNRPIVGYHGVIQSRVNISVFQYVAEKMPDVDFVIAGPVWKEMQEEVDRVAQLPNVFVPGPVPYPELPSLISCFDVAIIPHKVDSFTQSMNPLKIYEYLAAGKPIISTAVAGADQFQDLIKLAVSPEDFANKIKKELTADSSELTARRKEMAKQHGWSHRIQVMIDRIHSVQKEG